MLRERVINAIAVIKRKPEQRKIKRVLPTKETKAQKVLDQIAKKIRE